MRSYNFLAKVTFKQGHAKINPETVNEYFDNLESVLEGILTVFSTMMRQTVAQPQDRFYLFMLFTRHSMFTRVGLREDLQMQDIPVLSLVGLTMTPLRIGLSMFFFQLPKPKRSQL